MKVLRRRRWTQIGHGLIGVNIEVRGQGLTHGKFAYVLRLHLCTRKRITWKKNRTSRSFSQQILGVQLDAWFENFDVMQIQPSVMMCYYEVKGSVGNTFIPFYQRLSDNAIIGNDSEPPKD
jgi:hypothetical protein